jgi:hypothetical protein
LKGKSMGLTESEQKILNELLKKQRDSTQSEDDEPVVMCEIWDGDKYARVPLSVAEKWLEKNFGITRDNGDLGLKPPRPGGNHH